MKLIYSLPEQNLLLGTYIIQGYVLLELLGVAIAARVTYIAKQQQGTPGVQRPVVIVESSISKLAWAWSLS